MKKIIIITLLVTSLIAPITLLAQSRGDRIVGNYGFKVNSVKTEKPKVDSTTLQKNLEHKIFRQLELNAHYQKIPLIEDDRVVKAKELTKEHCNNNKCTFKQVLKAIFLGGKFPWETQEQYILRKQVECTPAGQPFK